MNTNTTKIHSKNHKNPQQSNLILLQQTIICSKSTKSTLEQCVDETDPTSLWLTCKGHCFLNNNPKNTQRTCNNISSKQYNNKCYPIAG